MAGQLKLKKNLINSFGLRKFLINQAFLLGKWLSPMHISGGLTVEPLTECNLRCPLCACPGWLTDRWRSRMSLRDFHSLVDQSKSLAPRYNFNFACEPLLHPEIAEMVEYVHHANRLSWLNTNGTQLSESLGRDLIEAHVDYMYYALDGLDAESHEFYRRGSDFQRVFENLMQFIAMKQRLKARHPYLVIFTLAHAKNYRQEEHYREFWSKYLGKGVDQFLFYPLQLNVTKGGYGKCQEELRKYLPDDLSKSRYKRDENGNLAPRFTNTARYNRCPYFSDPVVASNGDLYICCQDVFGKYKIGNVFERGFKELWKSPLAIELRQRARAMSLDICDTCNARGM